MARPPFDHSGTCTSTIKFLCSYGGKILPRYPDGILRYVGGHTRVLAVDRSISFSELLPKLEVLCGTTVSLKCQLPTEDLDALISIKSDEDLANLIEEYGLSSNRPSLKIRAFLLDPRSGHQQRTSPPSSSTSSPKSLSPRSSSSSSSSFSSTSAVGSTSSSRFSVPVATQAADRCIHHSPVMAFPVGTARKVAGYAYDHNGNPSTVYLVPSCSHWQ